MCHGIGHIQTRMRGPGVAICVGNCRPEECERKLRPAPRWRPGPAP